MIWELHPAYVLFVHFGYIFNSVMCSWSSCLFNVFYINLCRSIPRVTSSLSLSASLVACPSLSTHQLWALGWLPRLSLVNGVGVNVLCTFLQDSAFGHLGWSPKSGFAASQWSSGSHDLEKLGKFLLVKYHVPVCMHFLRMQETHARISCRYISSLRSNRIKLEGCRYFLLPGCAETNIHMRY